MSEAACPFCDYRGQIGSVKGHITKKSDPAHAGKSGPNIPRDELLTGDDPDLAEDGRSPIMTAPDVGDDRDRSAVPDCCDDPDRDQPDKPAFQDRQGEVWRFDEGDRICRKCGAVTTADGEVIR